MRVIDPECAALLEKLIIVYENPPPNTGSSMNIDQFRKLLAGHPHFDEAFECISDGYPLGLEDRNLSKLSKKVRNYVKDTRDLKAILERMVKEAQKCYIRPTLKSGKYVLNLLCVPKTNNETGLKTDVRVARNGSYKTGRTLAVNDKIPKINSTIDTLPNIKIYIRLLMEYEFVSIRDLKDAFRQLGVATPDAEIIIYCIFGMRFFDNRQAYGVASSAANCQHFTELLIWILEKHYLTKDQIDRVLVHIDDFILAAHTKKEACIMAEKFDEMCRLLGVQISHAKSLNGIQKGVVHGFGFDLRTKMVNIPEIKFCELILALLLCLKYRWADGKALESICGKLMHWAQFRKHAKVLCFRLMGVIHKLIRNNKRLRTQIFYIEECVCCDFRFWLKYCFFMREVSMESILYSPSITITAATDACGYGGGFIVGPHYGAYHFNKNDNKFGINHRNMHINMQEAHAVVMLIWNFRHILTGQKLLLYIDNSSVMYSIFKNWSGSLALMEYIHEIVLLLCICKIEIHVEYIASDWNGPADSLSRFEFKRFRKLIRKWGYSVDDNFTRLEYYPYLRNLRESVSDIDLHKIYEKFNI